MAGRLSDAEADRIGVDSYYQNGTTRTKANTTLFVSFRGAKPAIPDEQRSALAERMFSEIPGYVGVRQVRGMCFVDFDSIKASTAAMMRYQGQQGMTIDYDKDVGVAGKRRRENAESTKRSQHEAQSCSYFCAACGTKALKTSGMLLSAMPTRSTDSARVIDEAAALETLLLEPIPSAQPALVRRTKGVEKQYRLGCRSCGAHIAYRSHAAPLADGKPQYLYVHASEVRERPTSAVPHAVSHPNASSKQRIIPAGATLDEGSRQDHAGRAEEASAAPGAAGSSDSGKTTTTAPIADSSECTSACSTAGVQEGQ